MKTFKSILLEVKKNKGNKNMSYVNVNNKEFELVVETTSNEHTVSIVAYGDWWDEEFNTEEEAKNYLKEVWHFTDDQFQELLKHKVTYIEGEEPNAHIL